MLEWPFGVMRDALGPIRPGTVNIVAARPSNGKTTLLMNCFQAWLDAGKVVLYLGMEMSPDELRLQWAAWTAGYDYRHVMNHQWSMLPSGAREVLQRTLNAQLDPALVHRAIFAQEERITMDDLNYWMTTVGELKVDVVVIDHLGRLSLDKYTTPSVAMGDAITRIKSHAKNYDIPFVVASQIGRPEVKDALTQYIPPVLESMRASGKVEEEADVVIGLSRALKPGVREGDLKLVRLGQKPLRDLADENTMALRILKHRLNGEVIGNDLALYTHASRLYEERIVRDRAWMHAMLPATPIYVPYTGVPDEDSGPLFTAVE